MCWTSASLSCSKSWKPPRELELSARRAPPDGARRGFNRGSYDLKARCCLRGAARFLGRPRASSPPLQLQWSLDPLQLWWPMDLSMRRR